MTEPESTSASQEKELIRRVLAGERDAFRDLVIEHQAMIFNMIRRQLGDEEVAKELTQDTFLRAYKHLAKFKSKARFSTWLTRIALNVTSSYFASHRYKEKSRTVAFDHTEHEIATVDSEDRRLNTEELSQLQNAIIRLKPKFREVLVLCALEEKTYEETAEILGVAVGTVRSRLHRARGELNRLFFQGA